MAVNSLIRTTFAVELRRVWADAWVRVPRLEVLQFSTALPPAMDEATLVWRAGEELDATGDGSAVAAGYVPHGFFPDADDATHDFLAGLAGAYCRIVEIDPAYPDIFQVRWVGVIVAEARDYYGYQAITPTPDPVPVQPGQQTITALGLAHLLSLQTIDRAYAVARELDGDGASVVPTEDTVLTIDRVPAFNQTYQDRGLETNRTTPGPAGPRWNDSTPPPVHPIHAFSEDPPPASGSRRRPWNDADIVAYLLRFWQPAGHLDDATVIDIEAGEIQFTCEDFSALYGGHRVVPQEGKTVFQLFNAIAAAEVGLRWRVRYALDEALVETVLVEFFSVFELDLSTSGATIPANPDIVDVHLAAYPTASATVEKRDYVPAYNLVRVEGGLSISVFTLSHYDGSLSPPWENFDALVAEYVAAITTWTDLAAYSGEELAAKIKIARRDNDAFRELPRFRGLFSRYEIPRDWDWLQGTGLPEDVFGAQPAPATIVAPHIIPETGRVDLAGDPQTIWPHRRRLRNRLPLKIGYDYSTWPPTRRTAQTDAERSEQIPALAYVLERGRGILVPPVNYYVPVTAPVVRTEAANDLEGLQFAGANVSIRDDSPGVDIEYPYRHMLGHGEWIDGFTDPDEVGYSSFEAESWGFDWWDLLVTVAAETDTRIAFEVLIPPAHLPSDYPLPTTGRMPGVNRQLTIRVPEARMVYLAPGTVVGIDAEGMPVRSPALPDPIPDAAVIVPGVLQNDTPLLEAVATVAARWYNRSRVSVVIRTAGTTVPVPADDAAEFLLQVGSLLRWLDPGEVNAREVNTVVTGITVDCSTGEGSVTVVTGAAEVDPVMVARRP